MIVLTAGPGRLCALMEAGTVQPGAPGPSSGSAASHQMSVWGSEAPAKTARADGTSSRARTEDPLIKSDASTRFHVISTEFSGLLSTLK